MANNKKFQLDINKFLKVADKTGTKEIRSVAIEGLKGVMRKSPVDHGTFRGNWNVGLNTIDSTKQTSFTVEPAEGKYDQQAYSRGNAKIGEAKKGQAINISNSLPYANRLEYTNHSAQGKGMVSRTIMELKSALKKKGKKV